MVEHLLLHLDVTVHHVFISPPELCIAGQRQYSSNHVRHHRQHDPYHPCYVTVTDKETIEMINKPVNPLFRFNLRYKRWLP